MLFCFVYWAGNRTFCFEWTGSEMFAFGFTPEKAYVGPVKNALFCLMGRYRNVCVWFMARNCRFPKVGKLPTWEPQVTIARNCRFPQVRRHGSQPGNQRLPLQATAGYQRLELMLPNLGTIGYHCNELPVPKGWNWWFPTWEPKVTMARNCRFPEVRTYVFEAKQLSL